MTRKTFVVFETAVTATFAFVVFLMLLSVAHGQEARVVTETAQPDWSEMRLQRNADGSVEGSVCVRIVSDDGDSRSECSRVVRLAAPINVNRANALGDALRARALRKFGVDGGAP